MVYQLNITSRADQCLADIVDYLYYHVGGFGNPFSAQKFLDEYAEALDKLSKSPKSIKLCEEEPLNKLGYRRIHFSHLNYKIFYRVEGDVVTIDLICHDYQDYQNLL